MKMMHATLAVFLLLPLVAYGQSQPSLGEVVKLQIDHGDVSSLRLEIFDGETAQRLYDTGLVSGNRLDLALEELSGTMLEARSLKYELRAWNLAGELVMSQVSALPQLAEEIFSINFEVIPAGTVFVSDPIALEGSVDVAGDLSVVGAVQTGELRNAAGGDFFGSCANGSSIRTIQADGTVICEPDDAGGDNLGNHRATQNITFDPERGLVAATGPAPATGGARLLTGPLGGTFFAQAGTSERHRFGVRSYDAPSGTQDADFTIDKNGNVGIFRFFPSFPLDVLGNARIGTDDDFVLLGSDGNANIELRGIGVPFIDFSNDASIDFDMRIQLSGDDSLTIDGGRIGVGGQMTNPQYKLDLPNRADPDGRGRANAWVTYSSSRFKTNVRPIGDALSKLVRLRGVEFDWKAGQGGGRDIGFIAEEVGQVLPELVDWEENGEEAMGLDYDGIIPLLVEALKEQLAVSSRQSDRIARLENLLCRSMPEVEGCSGGVPR